MQTETIEIIDTVFPDPLNRWCVHFNGRVVDGYFESKGAALAHLRRLLKARQS